METCEIDLMELFDSGTNVEGFFYYKINEILIRKKDAIRLLNNEWLSEHVNIILKIYIFLS